MDNGSPNIVHRKASVLAAVQVIYILISCDMAKAPAQKKLYIFSHYHDKKTDKSLFLYSLQLTFVFCSIQVDHNLVNSRLVNHRQILR